MPINFLGRKLFPRLQPWLQRRRILTILVTLLVAVLFAIIVGALMFLGNSRH